MNESRFEKATFAKTTQDRRRQVLDAAASQFAAKGYSGANINDVARQAGISIGAMYSYFSSKQDLFLAVVDNATVLMEEILRGVAERSADVYEYVARMLGAAREFAGAHAALNQLYLGLTAQPPGELTVDVSEQIEAVTPDILSGLLERGKAEGIVRGDLDVPVYALCIDNIFMMYQFAFASQYHRQRLAVYLGVDRAADADALERGIAAFVEAALRPAASGA